MSDCGGAITNPIYLVDHDSSIPYTSPIIDLSKPLASICYQMKWSSSSVIGKFVWEASIFPDPYCWEQLVSCEAVELITKDQETLSGIVSIPNIWLTVGFVRFRWVPDVGSNGTFNVAIRLVPI